MSRDRRRYVSVPDGFVQARTFTLADLAPSFERLDAFEYEHLQTHLRRLVDAQRAARLRWSIAVEWQILAHSVRNCTSAADARYAIELRARPV